MVFFLKIFSLLDRPGRLKIVALLVGMLFCSILEGIGLSGIPLYINTVFNGQVDTGLLGDMIAGMKEQTGARFIGYFSLAIFGLYLFKNAYYYLLNYQIHRFIASHKTHLETTLVNKFIQANYLLQISNNSAYYLRTVRDADLFINKVLLPSITAILDALIIIAIGFVLMLQLPAMLIGLLLLVVSSSFILIALLRRKMKQLGGREMSLRQEVLKVLNETFLLNKEIHVYVNYGFFSNRFHSVASALNRTVFQHGRLNIAIKPLMEIVSIIALIVIVLYFLSFPQANVMGFLALLAVALVRMLPSLQALTTAINSIQYNTPVLDNIHSVLKDRAFCGTVSDKATTKIVFDSIHFREVSFHYPGAEKAALAKINLSVSRNQVIGVVGVSGAGKSTFVDLVLGLLKPTHGIVNIDNQSIEQAGDAWRNNIGYVPQTLNLLDDSILNNILFGRPFDRGKLDYALRFSGVGSFINNMHQGLDTNVGERGIKVSGGQRQRIGIARALYNEPKLLIFDEATSSLDHDSEQLVTDTIATLKGKITIMIISHRYAVLKHCDEIFEFKEGQLSSTYSYNQLIAELK